MSITRKNTKGMSREDWLKERRKSVGGSDLGAILGLSEWATPYSVWAEKTGRIPEKEPTEAMRIGTDLEAYVAERFCEVTGFTVRRVNAILSNDEYPHMHANIDRDIHGLNAGLECKTASAFNARKFADGDFPYSYYAQCVAYMAITGKPKWYLAVLVLGREFKIYRLTTEKDSSCPDWCESSVYVSPEEFESLKNVVADFWHYVETDTPPEFDGLEPTESALNTVYKYSDKDAEEVDLMGYENLLTRWDNLTAQEAQIKAEKNAIAETLKEELKVAEKGMCGSHRVSWDSRTRRTFDSKKFLTEHPEFDTDDFYKESTSRYFSIKEVKEK